MSKPLDPERPGSFSSSLVAGLLMFTGFPAEYPVCGMASRRDRLSSCASDVGSCCWVRWRSAVWLASICGNWGRRIQDRKTELSRAVRILLCSLWRVGLVRALIHIRTCGPDRFFLPSVRPTVGSLGGCVVTSGVALARVGEEGWVSAEGEGSGAALLHQTTGQLAATPSINVSARISTRADQETSAPAPPPGEPAEAEDASQVAVRLTGQMLPWALGYPPLSVGSSIVQAVIASLGHGRAVIYFVPGGDDAEDGGLSGDIAEHRGYCKHRGDFESRRVSVIGVSSQSDGALTCLDRRLGLSQALLSDPELLLASALDLPTIRVGGGRRYGRLALVISSGRIVKVFYPVVSAAESAGGVIGWMRTVGW
jgi:peroxiredoxin